MTTIAYIYKWTHVSTNRWYIGSRTKENCHPNDGYICSSKIVKPLIEQAPNEWRREILYTGTPADIIVLEAQLLESLDAKHDTYSYNLHNGDGDFTTTGLVMPLEWKQKISKSNVGKKRDDKAKENYRRANQLKAKDPEYLEKLRKPKPEGHGAKVSAATKGVAKTPEHIKAMSNARKGKKTGPCSEKRKESIRNALKGKHTLPLVICPHCGLEGRANMRRWHFDNCKKKI
jgi:hypothetical protein